MVVGPGASPPARLADAPCASDQRPASNGLVAIDYFFPRLSLLDGEGWPTKIARFEEPLEGARVFWDLRAIQAFMMQHAPSAFARSARWLSNNWPSISSFLKKCGLPSSHCQRGQTNDEDGCMNDAAVSEFAVVPLLLKWSCALRPHAGGAAAARMSEALVRICSRIDTALDLVGDTNFEPNIASADGGESNFCMALIGGVLYWDDDEDTPPCLQARPQRLDWRTVLRRGRAGHSHLGLLEVLQVPCCQVGAPMVDKTVRGSHWPLAPAGHPRWHVDR